jgi:hypothetical protein
VRIFGLDWHSFKLGGKMVSRPVAANAMAMTFPRPLEALLASESK